MVTYGAVAATKVRPPRPDQSALLRPRLLQAVDAVLQPCSRLASITGGMGYGKTTLAVQWVSRRKAQGRPVVWLTIDPADDQPARFWSLVVSAIELAIPTLGDGRLRRHPAPETSGDNAFIDSIITTIAEVKGQVIFVLDDCHALRDRRVLQDLDYFVLRSASNVRFILIGRSLPRLSALYQVNLDDALIEVDGGSLAFTRRELVRLVRGSPLDVDRLLDLTEGWPAATRLASRHAESVSSQNPPDATSDPLHRQLMRPLFDSYRPELQQLLLSVSTLATWTVEDLNHVLGRTNGAQVLDRLRAETGLIMDVSSEPLAIRHFRCHRLLRRFLDAHAAANPTDSLAAAHARMAAWLPEQGRHAEALVHAVQSGNPDVLRTTVATSGLELLWGGEANLILEISASQKRHSFQELTLLEGVIALRAGDPTVASEGLDRLKRSGAGQHLPAAFVLLATALQAQLDMSRGSFTDAVDLLEKVVEQPPLDDLDLYLTNVLAAAMVGVGRFEDALALSLQASRLARNRGNQTALVDARSVAAAVHVSREEFRLARAEASWAIRRAGETELRYGPSLRPAHLIAAWCAYHALDDSSARLHNAYVRRADSAVPVIARSNSKLSLILQFQSGSNRHEAAAGLLNRVRHDLIHGAFPPDLAICSLQTASMLLQLRHGDALETLKSELRQHQGVSGELHTISAWELLAAGHLNAARKLLSAVTAGYVESQSRCSILTAWALTCRIALEEDRTYEARTALGEALQLGAKSGTLRAFAFAGAEVRAAVVHEQLYFPAFGHIIARITRFRGNGQSSFYPPLTHRELDLLTLLPTFATVDEIAERLLISTNTVKTHVRGIYRKLGATSRREAIAIAQDLGLLPATASTPASSAVVLNGARKSLTPRYDN
ncbi:LuxR C-terminal-related transcriptional regulator [Arthrobacter sp. Bz4]|uniref:LuxR C-terminal-related transcriptional regulator n=1 Tax=Arthrobacter sp. Bz4 TaxID=2171979 RepID=UPI000D50BEDB|nr:LuxR C-terminal-related transcriptional regulator [Arthrobacter sp. Bz4]PVE19639.1 hypothetical protein DDA93_02500 [Arthrobacter sp. Bz4]